MTDQATSHDALAARRRRIEKGEKQEREAKKRSVGLQGMMELPLLEALEDKGGSARPRDVYGEIAERLNLDPDVREETRKAGGQEYAVFDQQVRWTRQTLVAKELVAGKRGIWELTDKGREKLTRIRRGKAILIYSLDNGLAFLAHAEEAADAIEPESLSLIFTSPPYPVVGREYGRFGVPEWLDWMSGLVGMWKDLLRGSQPHGRFRARHADDLTLRRALHAGCNRPSRPASCRTNAMAFAQQARQYRVGSETKGGAPQYRRACPPVLKVDCASMGYPATSTRTIRAAKRGAAAFRCKACCCQG